MIIQLNKLNKDPLSVDLYSIRRGLVTNLCLFVIFVAGLKYECINVSSGGDPGENILNVIMYYPDMHFDTLEIEYVLFQV